MKLPMLFRFSLYGFLKNQRYYEPFLILVFREKGLSFFLIGILIGFREICINIFEIPSGAVADLYGRRRSMIISFSAYIISFAIFALSRFVPILFLAMFFFAIGEAFRTGTHKAMIFDWLRIQGRADEKTRVYGYTRSWSKIGSAVSVLIAGALVFYTGSYSKIFWFSIAPYMLDIINFLGYPAVLDGTGSQKKFSMKSVVVLLCDAFKEAFRLPPMRRIIVEAMTFQGMFKASKDYLQPILKQVAIALPVFVALDDKKRAALLIAVVYFVLYLLSSVASRQSHRLAKWKGGEEKAARFLWFAYWVVFAALVPSLWFRWSAVIIVLFVVLEMLQNFWRPVLISRINVRATPEMTATILSIESQSISAATMLLAPILGWLVDKSGGFWPVATVGVLIATSMILTGSRSRKMELERVETDK